MLLAVHLNRDEVLVEDTCDLWVVEGLAYYDATPVGRNIFDTDEEQAIHITRELQSLWCPELPCR